METGMRVSLKTYAALTLPGTLSTAEHGDQFRFATICAPYLSDYRVGTLVLRPTLRADLVSRQARTQSITRLTASTTNGHFSHIRGQCLIY